MKDLKYLLAYIGPIAAYLGLYLGGYWSFGIIYVGFILIPLIELFTPGNTINLSAEQEETKLRTRFFDYLLYLNIPILYGILYLYFTKMAAGGLTTFEYIGMTMNTGSAVGILGINVGHELGHRLTKFEQTLSKMLLLPALYMHFFIEHNLGHHKHVSTPEDPATSRFGENIYAFFIRSVKGSYLDAWEIEKTQLQRRKITFWSMNNQMIQFQLIQFTYLLVIGFVFGWQVMALAVVVAIIGFLHLEAVNYVEHYGLVRNKLENGRYETVKPHHSWNSNHEMGRIFLYELTRHSDHHFKATRKYQVLRHFDESPQLPYGYPGSVLLAFVPPLWFSVMNKRVPRHQQAV